MAALIQYRFTMQRHISDEIELKCIVLRILWGLQ